MPGFTSRFNSQRMEEKENFQENWPDFKIGEKVGAIQIPLLTFHYQKQVAMATPYLSKINCMGETLESW